WLPSDGGRQPLPLPLQSMISEPVLRRIDALAAQGHKGAQQLATYFVGQGVGLMNKVKPAREVVREFIEDYLAATERLSNSLRSCPSRGGSGIAIVVASIQPVVSSPESSPESPNVSSGASSVGGSMLSGSSPAPWLGLVQM